MIPKHVRHHATRLRKGLAGMFKGNGLRWIAGGGVLVLCVLIIAVFAVVGKDRAYEGKVYPNVFVNGVDVGGKSQQEVAALFAKENENLSRVRFDVLYKDQQIATFSAEQLGLKSNVSDIAYQAYLIGRSEHKPSAYKERAETLLGFGSYRFDTDVQYDTAPFEEFIRITEDAYNRPAKNAKFQFEEGRVASFEADVKGLAVDSVRFRNDVEKALDELKSKPGVKRIVIADNTLEPEITLAEANSFGIEELIGEGKSDYSGSSDDRIYNVLLAASKFNGVIIPPGEEFSFNKIIGDISVTTGYRQAYVIQNGRTVLGDGGGVCQVSTTVFRAALNTGLPITEWHAHAYRVRYYENDAKPGFDATIYTPNIDLRFKNDTPSHILVQTEVDRENNLLSFRFYGKKDGRKVELSDATVWDVAPPPPEKREDDPNLPEGEVKQVDFPAWGAKSKFTYKVTKGDEVTFEKEFFASYRPWQAVFLVGKGPRP